MKQKSRWIEKRQSLRREAENVLSRLTTSEQAALPTEVLMHELLVHKVELEMQIEELRSAHDTMEQSRNRYVELYDSAPVGYCSVARDGLILEINLTGAALLGADRQELVGRRFAKFVAPRDQDHWNALFLDMMAHAAIGSRGLVLEMLRSDGASLAVYADCQRQEAGEAPPTVRVTLVDLDMIKRAATPAAIAPSGSPGIA